MVPTFPVTKCPSAVNSPYRNVHGTKIPLAEISCSCKSIPCAEDTAEPKDAHADEMSVPKCLLPIVEMAGAKVIPSRFKVGKILKGSLYLIPSPSPLVKIQIVDRKHCLWASSTNF